MREQQFPKYVELVLDQIIEENGSLRNYECGSNVSDGFMSQLLTEKTHRKMNLFER